MSHLLFLSQSDREIGQDIDQLSDLIKSIRHSSENLDRKKRSTSTKVSIDDSLESLGQRKDS